ncbi:nucleotidyltransferase family protein [Frigoribacterium sp. 2-23]|uniref:nucleotidyltransferase family protein n=1 Tax=Frigoribacterium sp. 2-23 TaxID=3415006 RepID=UPI003C6FB72F
MSIVGVLLAAGAGSRMGWPKALTHADDGSSWLATAIDALLGGGCDHVIVVLGAQADRALELVPTDRPVQVTVADDWGEGLSASLRAGLAAAETTEARVAVITLVDLPELPAKAVARLLGEGDTRADAATVRQAVFGERPGHPVVVGREHWAGLTAWAHGDQGARGYLREHGAERVDCSDLWSGRDVDSLS